MTASDALNILISQPWRKGVRETFTIQRSGGDQTVEVTLQLSKDRYEQIRQAAGMEHRPVEDLLDSLIVEGLDSHASIREILEQVSQGYRARLAREGKLSRSAVAVRQELSDLREQIACDLYPG